MGEEAERLRAILHRFANDPNDTALWAEARELADRFTLDQLCAMAAPRGGEVGRLFDRVMGRNRRQDDSGLRRAIKAVPTWQGDDPRDRRTDGMRRAAR